MWGCAHTDNPAGFSKEFEAVPNFRLSWGEALRQQSAACWPVRICQTPVLTVFVCCSSLLSAYASEDGLAAASYSQQYQGECAQWWVRKTSPAHNSGGKFLVSVFSFPPLGPLLSGHCRPVWGAAICSLWCCLTRITREQLCSYCSSFLCWANLCLNRAKAVRNCMYHLGFLTWCKGTGETVTISSPYFHIHCKLLLF